MVENAVACLLMLQKRKMGLAVETDFHAMQGGRLRKMYHMLRLRLLQGAFSNGNTNGCVSRGIVEHNALSG